MILYLHGAGWVFGNHHTHDRLIHELAVGAKAAVVFPQVVHVDRPTASEVCWRGGRSAVRWRQHPTR